MASKTIDDKRYYPKPLVASKKKPKIYYYKKQKLSKGENEFMNYMQCSKEKKKESGEYSLNHNLTIDSVEIPKSSKQKGNCKMKKAGHKKSESISSVSWIKPRISSTINHCFLPQKGIRNKDDYSSSVKLNHQRRASETKFSKHISVVIL